MSGQGGDMDGLAEGKDRNFVTALARGLDVLRSFRPGEVLLTNTDLSERTGLPKPTVSRLTHTLCQLGYLVQDRETGAYRLGVGVLQLGMGVLAGMDICDRAAEVLRGLRAGTNPYITAALGEAHRAEAVYVAVSRSRENVSLSMHVGSRLPLFRSAMGRAILAGMTEEDRRAAIQAGARDTGEQIAALEAEARSAVEQYRARGYCSGYGDWRADVNAIAVPVVSLGGSRVHGLNVGGPSFHIKVEELENTYAPLLIAAGKALSLTPG